MKMERVLKKNWNRKAVGQTLRVKKGPLLSVANEELFQQAVREANKDSDDDSKEYSWDSDFD
jgi:hypothetical protein